MRTLWSIARDTINAWLDDRAPSMGAAIAYYTLFSIAPLLVIAVAIVGFVFGEEAARGELAEQLGGLLGEEAASAVQGLVREAGRPREGAFAFALGVGAMLIGATAVFAELQGALDRIWEVPPERQETGLRAFLRTRVLSFAMVLGVAMLLLVSMAVSAAMPIIGRLSGEVVGEWLPLARIANPILTFLVFTLAFALIYRFVPRTDIAWRDVWIGAAVTSLLFVLGKAAIDLYLGMSGVTTGFGAAGAIVVLMVWVYYSAQIFLLGAEFTWVQAQRRKPAPAGADFAPPAALPASPPTAVAPAPAADLVTPLALAVLLLALATRR